MGLHYDGPMQLPRIIQGGMGAGVSSWPLARAVSVMGQLGVVSCTGISTLVVRRLQDGDQDGSLRRAFGAFPFEGVARQILDRYFIPGGKRKADPYVRVPIYGVRPTLAQQHLAVLASFAEVYLAKQGHSGLVGVNLLEKMKLTNLPCLYGAMLAGVDVVLMGAGIPREIPGALDLLAQHQAASLNLFPTLAVHLDPHELFDVRDQAALKRPQFLAVVASSTLAANLAKKANGRVDGFVVEGPTAGGHNAPPRGPMKLNDRGEPIYGTRDEVDLAEMRELGLPFWLAGSYGNPDGLRRAVTEGARGIQVGTLFAFCEESGLDPELRNRSNRAIVSQSEDQSLVFTDPRASPTGFPFKVLDLPETVARKSVYESRPRRCDLGFLREVVMGADGVVTYRCPSEDISDYIAKGGALDATVGRKCLCNALLANVGHPQVHRDGYVEHPLITSGDDLTGVRQLLSRKGSYTAQDALHYLLDSRVEARLLNASCQV